MTSKVQITIMKQVQFSHRGRLSKKHTCFIRSHAPSGKSSEQERDEFVLCMQQYLTSVSRDKKRSVRDDPQIEARFYSSSSRHFFLNASIIPSKTQLLREKVNKDTREPGTHESSQNIHPQRIERGNTTRSTFSIELALTFRYSNVKAGRLVCPI
jgi:hypothetical protein